MKDKLKKRKIKLIHFHAIKPDMCAVDTERF